LSVWDRQTWAVIVDCALYQSGARQEGELALEAARSSPGAFV